MHQFNAINISLLALLMISPIFQFTFTALPEMLCYYLFLLYIYYYLCLENKVEESKSLNIKFSLCLIALLLTKPLFVITFLVSLAMYLIRNGRIFLHHALLSVFAGVIWLISNITKLTRAQVLNNNNSLRKVFYWNFQGNVNINNSDTLQKASDSITTLSYRIVSELNSQISLGQRVSIILMLLPFVFLFTSKSFGCLKIIFTVYLGAVITQGYSGSYGINFRYLNYGVLISILLSIFHAKTMKLPLQRTNDDVF